MQRSSAFSMLASLTVRVLALAGVLGAELFAFAENEIELRRPALPSKSALA